MSAPIESCRTWVIDHRVDAGTFERLGDARQLADASSDSVGALIAGTCRDPEALIAAGADCVKIVEPVSAGPQGSAGGSADSNSASGSADSDFASRSADPGSASRSAGPNSASRLAEGGSTRGSAICVAQCGPMGRTANAEAILAPFRPRLVLASGSPDGREWAARLAVRRGWRLFSPALQASIDRDARLVVTALSACGRYSRKATLGADETAVLTFNPGVAEAVSPDSDRTGTVARIDSLEVGEEPIRIVREIPADPREVDIRYADRIVAGGRGLGGTDGFQRLARVARALKAAVAASRVAVDLGWIDRERQVGQTGKTIAPALYLACGISGASHHLAGIAEARHIVAINTDPNAPIFKAAHFGLVADLHEVLSKVETQLAAEPESAR